MHPAESATEILQCYDEHGKPTEGRPRSAVKQLPYRWWYGVTRIWLVNDQGQIMCSKRSERLSSNPGKWQTYFGGHVALGHTHLETAIKELQEEAGLSRQSEDFYLIDQGRNEEKKCLYYAYVVSFNGSPADLNFTDNEVTEARWMSLDETVRQREISAENWCNSCKPETQSRIWDWLNSR